MATATTQGTGPERERLNLTPEQRNIDKVGGGPGKADFLKYARDAERINAQFEGELRSRWERSYRSYRSEHFQNSKYRMKQWEGRSKLFRPKTRSAVRSSMTVAAEALFSTADIVTVEATQKSDPKMMASAKVIQELLNYRLDRTTPRGGLPWFLTAMGSVFNANVTGVTVSKQYWDYKSKSSAGPRMIPHTDPDTGETMFDPQSGQLLMKAEMVKKVTTDRPMIDLIPSENVMLDLAAPWYDPAQLSAYFVVRYPMLVGDFRQMAEAGSKPGVDGGPGIQWLNVEEVALKTVAEDYNAMGVRIAREGGQDTKGVRREGMSNDFGIIWVHENFFRHRGEDYHFWSVGTEIYASMPVPTEVAYPHLKGDRPYIYGYGAIEPHLVYPQSAVESWQPLQQEANDIVNLRLDSLKQALEPVAKVKRGSMLDLTQLTPGRRGAPGSIVQVAQMDDLDFAQWPRPPGEAYAEMNNINADFDDLAGQFSGSSVNTNRSLNETVGGMRLLNASSGSTKEFDLRVWVETWCEPTLRQVIKLEQFYESDDEILAICGERAKVWQRFGVDELTDEHLTREVTLRVNVGIGAAAPREKLQNMQMGLTIIGGVTPFFDRPVQINAEQFCNEIFGLIGHKDAERFLVLGQPGQPMPGQDDGGAAATAAAQQQDSQTKLAIEQMRGKLQIELAQMNNASAAEREQIKAQIQLLTTMMTVKSQHVQQTADHRQEDRSNAFGHLSSMMVGEQKGKQSIAAIKAKPAPGTGKPGGGKPTASAAPPAPMEPEGDEAMAGPTIGAPQGPDVSGQLDQIMQALQDIAGRLGRVEKQQSAPATIVRDASGAPIGVKKGDVVSHVIRDAKTGQPVALQ